MEANVHRSSRWDGNLAGMGGRDDGVPCHHPDSALEGGAPPPPCRLISFSMQRMDKTN